MPQFRHPSRYTATVTAQQLLDTWEDLDDRDRVAAFAAIPREEADDLFFSLSSRDQLELLRALPPGERRIWLRLLPPDDSADVIQAAEEDERPNLLEQLDDVTRREVRALLAYKEDQAGGLMSPRFARVRPDMTVDEAISYVRRQAAHVETIYYVYALDDAQRLLGVVSFRNLFSSEASKTVREVLQTEIVKAGPEMDQEAVAKLVAQHHLLAIPVVDADGRMQGIVTVDDIVDVVQEEASEDIQKVGGMEALDEPYLEIAFWRMVKKRAGW